jgi:hypothetical protein
MLKKIIFRVGLLLVVAIASFVVYSVLSLFIPRYGAVANVSDLRNIYAKVGGPIAAVATNSLIQQFPFDGPISWRIILFKDPIVFLNAKTDTNRLHQFISNHPDTTFLWSGAGGEVEDGWPAGSHYPSTTWTNIWFEKDWVVEGYEVNTEGKVDLRSCMVSFRSLGGEPARAK